MAHIDWFNPAKLGWRTAQFGYFVRHVRQHRDFRHLLSEARAAGLVSPGPIQRWKYLGKYLSLEASFAMRYRLIAHHYRFLLDRLSGTRLARHWASGFSLWEAAGDSGIRYEIDLSQPTFSKMEGETRLRFRAGDETLWTLTFVIGSGRDVDGTEEPVLILGALQGTRNVLEAIRAATRDNARLRPHTMLVIASLALAEALGVRKVVAVPGRWSPVTRYRSEGTMFDRDSFWMESGAHAAAGGWLAIPLHQSVNDGDRPGKRTLFKAALSEAIRETTSKALRTS